MKIVMWNPAHEVAYQDVIALVRKHADQMTLLELLAVAANMLGKLVALQDQRTTTPAMAMQIVDLNIQQGNKQAMAQGAEAGGVPN